MATDGAAKPSVGVYVPPHKLRALTDQLDKSSEQYQRITWDALRKSINGLINKVNTANIRNIVPELFRENIMRGRGLLCRSLMKAQAASPTFTAVYAGLVAVINTKLPQIGELLLHRLVAQFQRAYKQSNKKILLSTVTFLAHLVNQQVAGEMVALEILTLLLEDPSNDSIEVTQAFTREVGQTLAEQQPKMFHIIFERLRAILHEGQTDKRVQYMIETLFAVRKSGFLDYPGVPVELDLVEAEEQITHDVSLDTQVDRQESLDFFHVSTAFLEEEAEYADMRKEILGDEEEPAVAPMDSGDGNEDNGQGEGAEGEQAAYTEIKEQSIQDQTDMDVQNLKRVIYLTIMSAVDFEECAHKLLKIQMKEGQEPILCDMILKCCSEERTFNKFFGLLGQRFCVINADYQAAFDTLFKEQYLTIHRLETNKLRNVACFFAHLLQTDALPWSILEYIHLNEDDTTSSSRIFIKILFQQLSEYMSLVKLNERLKDPYLAQHFEGILPRDHPKNTRFAINYFTSIGLGGLTDDLRDHLKREQAKIAEEKAKQAAARQLALERLAAESSSDSDSDSSSSDSDSSSDSSDSSSSSDSDSSGSKRRRKRRSRSRDRELRANAQKAPTTESQPTAAPSQQPRSPDRRPRRSPEQPNRERSDRNRSDTRDRERERDRGHDRDRERRYDERRRSRSPRR
eukprot:TRINITY_DN7495_c0_g1_i1.p1 TRINITY_DN7495_c0_g1~~TRINITY_DN7495_c0_g1_i1.p1  ORF type:complete len:686 (-),score=122.07 TRINITY_DN7495_c0_g1_i1:42-2099(-)